MVRTVGKNDKHRPKIGMIHGALDDLAVFVHVARLESFAEASRRLRIPTSTVSRSIARLEESLGVSLLRRTSRAVALTVEGQGLLAGAGAAVDTLGDALTGAANHRAEVSGLVRVTAPTFTGATRVATSLSAFVRAHPKVSVEIDASNVMRDLVAEGFDFGIRGGPTVDADFVARKLWRGEFGLYASRELVRAKLRGTPSVTREQLSRLPCVVMRPTTVWRFVDLHGELVTVAPRVAFAINDPRGVLDVARASLGVAIAPLDAVPAKDVTLVRIHTDFGNPEPMDIYAVYPSRRLLPLRVRTAIDWLATSK
jgi:LysR family transcriptional regulator, transcriptional activator AphB